MKIGSPKFGRLPIRILLVLFLCCIFHVWMILFGHYISPCIYIHAGIFSPIRVTHFCHPNIVIKGEKTWLILGRQYTGRHQVGTYFASQKHIMLGMALSNSDFISSYTLFTQQNKSFKYANKPFSVINKLLIIQLSLQNNKKHKI